MVLYVPIERNLVRTRLPPALPAALSLAALAIVLVGSASGQASTSRNQPKARTIAVVRDFVGALAQSKNRLAWLRGPSECPKAEILDLRSRRRARVSSRRGAACGSRVESFGVLAFDGTRILWQAVVGAGNTVVYNAVFSAALSDRRTRSFGGGGLGIDHNEFDYEPPLPMADYSGHLVFYDRCEVDCDASEVRAVVGRRSHRLFKATRPMGLAVTGSRLAVLEDRIDCCQNRPVWSPNGLRLAWIHNAAELLTENRDGSGRRLLATGRLGPPNWSTDGSKIAFSRFDSVAGRWLLEVINADGTEERTLTEGSAPEWSPRGSEIAFVRGNDIYRISADDFQETRLTSDAVAETFGPQWSPNGNKLLVQRGSRAYVVDSGAGGATILAPPRAESPAWSPDGTQIAFSADGALAVMNADGSGVQLLTNNSTTSDMDRDPAWSSDGAKIAVQRENLEEGPWSQILVLNADGSGRHSVSVANGGEPTWAPGRPTLAWGDADYPSYHGGGIFVANANGSGRIRIAGGADALVEIRNVRSGALLHSFVAPGTAVAVAMSATYIAVVVRSEARLELHRYRADGTALGSSRLPSGSNPFFLTVGRGVVVYGTERRVFAVNAETGSTRLLTRAAAVPVGLSILNRRVVWAENLGKKGARVRAIDLAG